MADEKIHATQRTLIWQGLWRPGAEWCTLDQSEEGWRLAGTALVAVDGAPWQVTYAVGTDARWQTRDVQIAARAGDQPEQHLRLTVNEARVWRIERGPGQARQPGDDREDIDGLHDIDLGFSPATNTLPLRRLTPDIGESVDVTAVWVRFPELTIEPLPQRYTRRDARRYRYESAGGAFMADLEVDDLGLVIAYEGGWERIASTASQNRSTSASSL